MKIHLGCGTVYLDGYVNIDSAPDYLSSVGPLLEQNRTTKDKYYKQAFGTMPGHVVADVKHDLFKPLPFSDGSVDEVVMYQVLEHFPRYNADALVGDIARVLRPGGEFYVSVPDVKQTAKLLVEASTPEQEDWAIRLLHGTQRNKWSHHYCGYLPRTLHSLLKDAGFAEIEVLPNINFYPAIRRRAVKPA